MEEIEKTSEEVSEETKEEAVVESTAPSSFGEVLQAAVTPEPVVEKAAPVVEEPVEAASKEKKEEKEEVEPEEEPLLRDLNEEQAKLPWYAVHAYSGYEERAKAALEERVRLKNLEDLFGNIVIPQETVQELVRGKKKISKRKFFPGYMMVQMQLNDETWHLVSETPKVTGFVGGERNPTPLSPEEVETLINQMQGGASSVRSKVSYEQGDQIKVVDGPFAEFNGTVEEVKPDKGKLKVLISIFGRNTPVELDFVQVEKV